MKSKRQARTWWGLAGLATALALAWAAPGVLAEPAVMVLGPDDLAPLQRPKVVFKHSLHKGKLACFQCHHDFDKFGKNSYEGDGGGTCSDCHSKAAGDDNPLALADAFHLQCRGCHQSLRAKGNRKAPVMCGQCHRRGAQPKKTAAK